MSYTSVRYVNGKGERICVQIDNDGGTILKQTLPDGRADVKKVSKDEAMKKLAELKKTDGATEVADLVDMPDFKSVLSPILAPLSVPVIPAVPPIIKSIKV